MSDFGWWEGGGFCREVGSADEGVDVDFDFVAVGAVVVGIGEEAAVGFRAAVFEVVAGVEDVPEEGFGFFGRVIEAFLDAAGDDFGSDEFGECVELGEHAVAEWVVEVEGDDEVGHDDRLAHVDFEVVEAGDGNVFESEGHEFVVAGAPVAEGGGVVSGFAEEGCDGCGG